MSIGRAARHRPRLLAGLGIALGVAALGLSQVARSRLWFHTIGGLHVWYHLGLFAVLGLLAVRSPSRWPMRFWGLIFAVLLGFAIEWGEVIRFEGIVFEWDDIRMDLLGLLLGAVAGWLCSRRVEPGSEGFDA